ncbi:hypothetical protein LZZ85_16870 [Terrimonas sp. NA20]|uniref:Lipoprotein n=1 Tax=Terrimonas ginsenosidimutans TaxID=2908004 RepID=A0ABS9KUF4_9BACT|nr:hypothetical protein [Terrimonas ginsenosidimutans]MCG2615972.1 hypothetical protein [Terrimonas ginsenosidimutans]
MKIRLMFFITLLSALCITGCSKDNTDHGIEYMRSYSAFLDFKKSSNNSYQYQVLQSSWTGSSVQTTITVRAGRVTNRDCVIKRYVVGILSNVLVAEEWQENENTLNTHTAGYPIRTLDEIYHLAKNDWLVKRAGAANFFEANNQGMISSSGYYYLNCADDCTVGVHISWIKNL